MLLPLSHHYARVHQLPMLQIMRPDVEADLMHPMQRRLAASCGGNGGNGFFIRSFNGPSWELNISLPSKGMFESMFVPFPVWWNM